MAVKQKSTDNLGACLLVIYALVAWCVLGDAALPFPLSEGDQHRVASALGVAWGFQPDSWIADALDPWMASLLPKDPYPLLLLLRRLAGTLALMGLVAWVWRSLGWVRGIWVAVLGISLLPLQWVAGTLAPQSFCLALLVWGHFLLHGPPWTKTGMAEAFGGGVLLGGSAFAAPWGWLFCMAVPLRTLWSPTYRAKLESGFWWGLVLGLLPGLVWWWKGGASAHIFGFHLVTLEAAKLDPLLDLAITGWGLPVLALVLLGYRAFSHPVLLGTQDLLWPLGVALLLGYADLPSSCLGLPGVILLALAGLERIGKVFVSHTEKVLIPTLLLLGIGYYTFCAGHQQIRHQQAYSRESAGLADLVLERITPQSVVYLGRQNSILLYLNALDQNRQYLPLDLETLRSHSVDLPVSLTAKGVRSTNLWVDPRLASSTGDGVVVEKLLNDYRSERVVGNENAELARVKLSSPR